MNVRPLLCLRHKLQQLCPGCGLNQQPNMRMQQPRAGQLACASMALISFSLPESCLVDAGDNRFSINAQGDPVEFWTWLVHSLRTDLGASKRKSVFTQCLQARTPCWHVCMHLPQARLAVCSCDQL